MQRLGWGRGSVGMLVVAGALLAALAFPVAAGAVLPQQLGSVDLLTQANVEIDGYEEGGAAGYSVAAGDVNGDGIDDVIVGSPYGDGPGYTGTAYVVFGRATLGLVELGALGPGGFEIENVVTGDNATDTAAAGDVNGDGLDDVILGAPEARNAAGEFTGGAYVVFGKTDPAPVNLEALGSGGFLMIGSTPGETTGICVAGAGDVNGDGRADVVVGAPGTDYGSGNNSGSAYVVFGKADTGTVELGVLGPWGYRLDGTEEFELAGLAVAGAGNVFGDGRSEVIVGADRDDGLYVVGAQPPGTARSLATIGPGSPEGFRIDGSAPLPIGRVLAGAGDVNGDGRADVIVGVPQADGPNTAFVVFGRDAGSVVSLDALTGGFAIEGDLPSFGDVVAGVGDVNGDGRADVVVGAPRTAVGRASSVAGAAFVVFGKPDGATVDVATLGAGGFTMLGGRDYDYAGSALAGAGDINGDGRDDVIVGAPGRGLDDPPDAGEAYVVYGFGAPSVTYVPLVAPVGRAIAPHVPAVKRTGSATFSVSPALPAGLAFDTASGTVTGTPSAPLATTTFTVTMTDLAGSTTAPLAITLTVPAPPPPVPPPVPPVVPTCEGKAATIVATGGARTITGTAGRDVIIGGDAAETIDGRGGDDTICSGRGKDVVHGGTGADLVRGGAGNDRLFGDSGNDRLLGGTGADDLRGGSGDDSTGGGDDDDRVDGGAGDDVLDEQRLSGRGNDRLLGGSGDDRIRTAGGTKDRVDCGPGDDSARLDVFDKQRRCDTVVRVPRLR